MMHHQDDEEAKRLYDEDEQGEPSADGSPEGHPGQMMGLDDEGEMEDPYEGDDS